MKPIVIYGNGSVAEASCYYLRHDSEFNVVAFTVDQQFIGAGELMGLPVLPFEQILGSHPPSAVDMFIAVGHVRVNRVRADKYQQARDLGYRLISYVSSHAITWPDLVMGDNCKIGAGANISPFVRLGSNVNIGGGSSIGHHTVIGDHCSIAPGATIAGNVIVEPRALIGAHATIRDRVRISRECVVGAGAVILKDTRERGVYLGQEAELLPITSDRLPLG